MKYLDLTYIKKQLLFLLLILLLCLVCLAIGLMIGYSVIGDGKNPLSILSLSKWSSLLSKFTGS